MKKTILFTLLFLFLGTSFAINNFYSPDYENSDVVIETAWGTSDKITNVDVVIFTNNENTTFYLMKDKTKKNELYLVDGTTIKIYTNNQLMKTFTQ
jgi:hypothetical protein